MELLSLLLIFIAGLIASAFGTLVGGGSLLTIPVLIFLGLPPHVAVGTNRFGAVGLPITGWYKFHLKKLVNYKIGFTLAFFSLFGSILGANLVLQISETSLRYTIAGITLIILIFVMLKPKLGIEKTKIILKKKHYIIGAIIGFFLGIYTGFYGAGSGTFFSYLLILLFGQTFLESAGTRKIAAFFSSLLATIVFILNGVVDYQIGIVLFISMLIGSYIGAHYSDRIGNIWIKRLFFVIVIVMIIKLVF